MDCPVIYFVRSQHALRSQVDAYSFGLSVCWRPELFDLRSVLSPQHSRKHTTWGRENPSSIGIQCQNGRQKDGTKLSVVRWRMVEIWGLAQAGAASCRGWALNQALYLVVTDTRITVSKVEAQCNMDHTCKLCSVLFLTGQALRLSHRSWPFAWRDLAWRCQCIWNG